MRNNIIDEGLLNHGLTVLPKVLGGMGFNCLREGQDEAVFSIVSGVDTICVMPTAAGKSAAFQIPALCHGWRMLVFSPLKALMRDQMKALRQRGIPAVQMSSDQEDVLNSMAAVDWSTGDAKIMYVAPERLKNETFLAAMRKAPPEFLVVDEAHCLSFWGDNFRGDYSRIGELVEKFNPKVVAAFTATYTSDIGEDVKRVLGIPNCNLIRHYPRRSNLDLRSRPYESDYSLYEAVKKIEGPVLVYCGTQRETERIAEYLSTKFGSMTSRGEVKLRRRVAAYHGGLSDDHRTNSQDRFMNNELEVMVATNAFGLGVDKPDIRAVIHADYPGSPEALSQETGRGGRDGEYTLCLTLQRGSAADLHLYFLRRGHPSEMEVRKTFKFMAEKADRFSVVKLSSSDIAANAGVNIESVEAIFQNLISSAVIEPRPGGEKIHSIRVIREGSGRNFAPVTEQLHNVGTLEKSFYLVDFDMLCHATGFSYNYLRSMMDAWSKEGAIEWKKPTRGSNYRIIGGIEQVDFVRLNKKRELAYGKLDKMKEYFRVPDTEKHEFLEHYFKKTWDLE